MYCLTYMDRPPVIVITKKIRSYNYDVEDCARRNKKNPFDKNYSLLFSVHIRQLTFRYYNIFIRLLRVNLSEKL